MRNSSEEPYNGLETFEPNESLFHEDLFQLVIHQINTESTYSANTDKYKSVFVQILSALHSVIENSISPYNHYIKVSFTTSFYSKNTLAKEKGLSFRLLTKIVVAFEQLELITKNKGNEINGITKVYPTEKLLGFLNTDIHFNTPALPSTDQFIILKDSHKEAINIGDNHRKTYTYRFTVHCLSAYNEFMLNQCVCLDLDDQRLEGITGSLDSRILYRIFNNDSFNEGGRLYRGWWQNIKSKYRRHIVINGEKTVEIDYSGMHFRLLYEQVGISIDEFDDNYDPYDIGLNNWKGKSDTRRKVIKTYTNAALNDSSGKYRLDTHDQDAIGIDYNELKQRVLDKHNEISEYFNTGYGLRLQKVDSDIALRVLLTGVNDGVPILPVHDSFIVPHSYASSLKTSMKFAFNIESGSITDKDITTDLPRSLNQFDDPLSTANVDIYQTEVIGEGKASLNIMNRYYLSWLQNHNDI